MWQANAWWKGGEDDLEVPQRDEQGIPVASSVSIQSTAAKERGNALFRGGDHTQALQQFEAAVAFDESNWQALSNMALVLFSQGKYEATLAAANASLRHRPDGGKALCLRGLALAELSQPHEALKSLQASMGSSACNRQVRKHAVLVRQKLELSLALNSAGLGGWVGRAAIRYRTAVPLPAGTTASFFPTGCR